MWNVLVINITEHELSGAISFWLRVILFLLTIMQWKFLTLCKSKTEFPFPRHLWHIKDKTTLKRNILKVNSTQYYTRTIFNCYKYDYSYIWKFKHFIYQINMLPLIIFYFLLLVRNRYKKNKNICIEWSYISHAGWESKLIPNICVTSGF